MIIDLGDEYMKEIFTKDIKNNKVVEISLLSKGMEEFLVITFYEIT